MAHRTLFALLMAASLSAPLFAQPAPQDGPPDRADRRPGRGASMMRDDDDRMPMRGGRQMMDALNLTDQQKVQMEKLRTELEKKQVTINGKIAVLRVDMKELLQAENPDRGAIEKKMKEVSDLQHQMKVNGLDHLFAVKGILTPDQQKIWKKHMLKLGEERFGMGMGMGHGPMGRMKMRGR